MLYIGSFLKANPSCKYCTDKSNIYKGCEPTGYISYFRRNSDVPGEIGYRLPREHYGRGYATEAGKEALRHWKEDAGIKEIFAAASLDNLASIRVLEKLGFVPGVYVMVNGWEPGERVRFSVMVLSGMQLLKGQYIHLGYKITESEGSEAENDKRV